MNTIEKKKISFSLLVIVFFSQIALGEQFHKKVDNLLSGIDVPTLKVADIKDLKEYIFLDARSSVEYSISHIPKAIRVGYQDFDLLKMKDIDRAKKLIVYCSVGYRSAKITQNLIKNGYKAFNLFGGIFEWSHEQKPLVDKKSRPTLKVHTYNKKWSQWLERGEKVY